MDTPPASALDHRIMAAAIRLAERHVGLTGTNPSVAALIARCDGHGARIVGRSVTAIGGRPHAETAALAEAGASARGATAYVTLEPCAHHGKTPPCAKALAEAGVSRVVTAAADPDRRVDGRGHAMLRAEGVALIEGLLAAQARRALSGYLVRQRLLRPEVTLKLAVSRDGCIGRRGEGQSAITGAVANAQTHLLRARSDAILVGVGTVIADDPLLTCRLPGLSDRSPRRIVLDPRLRTPTGARVVSTARRTLTRLVALGRGEDERRRLAESGCEVTSARRDAATGGIDLPALLEDLAADGISSLLVEGGAATATGFLERDLVDRLVIVQGPDDMGTDAIAAPITLDEARARFRPAGDFRFGRDRWFEFERRAG